MFVPVHLLPQNTGAHQQYRERWDTREGRELHEKILLMIRKGAGEDFLQSDFQSGRLGFLEDERDLRGFKLFGEDIVFPKADNFQAVDFSYAEWWHSKFTNALFYCEMSFVRIYGCTFKNCTFVFNRCYGSIFEKVTFIDCDFIEHDKFTNCSFAETAFKNTFFPNNIFFDCSFDSKTEFTSFPNAPVAFPNKTLQLKDADKSELFRAIGEAYAAGRVHWLSRDYRFLSLKYSTRFNTHSFFAKLGGLIFEFISGYGLRPSRVLIAMLSYFVLALFLFLTQVEFKDALLLTTGALFTFGANAHLLNSMNLFFHIVYVVSSFVGISLTALFITVIFNVFLSQR